MALLRRAWIVHGLGYPSARCDNREPLASGTDPASPVGRSAGEAEWLFRLPGALHQERSWLRLAATRASTAVARVRDAAAKPAAASANMAQRGVIKPSANAQLVHEVRTPAPIPSASGVAPAAIHHGGHSPAAASFFERPCAAAAGPALRSVPADQPKAVWLFAGVADLGVRFVGGAARGPGRHGDQP